MNERFPSERPDEDPAAAELLASLDFEIENPHLKVEVSPATLGVIVEYSLDKKVNLAHAVHDLLGVGMFVIDNVDHMEVAFPNGERDYQPPELDPEWFKFERIDVLLDVATRMSFKNVCEERGQDEETMFAHLVDTARRVRILQKRGAEFALKVGDGKFVSVNLFNEDEQI